MSYYMYLKNLKLYKNRCGFTLSLYYFRYIELGCSSMMSLRVLEVLTYTVCARKVSLTSSLSNQTSVSSHILTLLLPRALFEATTIWCYLGFYVQSDTFQSSMPIQMSRFILKILDQYSCNFSPRFRTKLLNNKVRVVADDFPALLYPHDGYDPDDVESGLLRNPILLRVGIIDI